MGEKFLLLNSGGFDSVVMTHRVHQVYPEASLNTIWFKYGQPNCTQEYLASKACAEKVKAKMFTIELPNFVWTNGDFYKGTSDAGKQYIEYRNLVFLSYACSLAESIGCSKIFMATHYFPHGFKDCNNEFIDNFNRTIAQSGIQVVTPFAYMYKEDLMAMAKELGVEMTDFFSCNNPDELGNPCGRCPDCLVIKDMYSG